MTYIVNLYGGPGTGKSTTAAHLFALLKQRGVSAELVREYAKDVVWDGHLGKLEDQLYLLAKQKRHLERVLGKVDVVVTDSPLLMFLVYGERAGMPFAFTELVRAFYREHEEQTIDVFLRRLKPYDPAGRVQTEEQARALDNTFRSMLRLEVEQRGSPVYEIAADAEAARTIAEMYFCETEPT